MITADEAFLVSAIACNRITCQSEETGLHGISVIRSSRYKLIDTLNDLVFFKKRLGNELGILKIYLILFVITFIGKFTISENRQSSYFAVIILNLKSPNFIGLVFGNIIQSRTGDTGIFSLDIRIACSVSALALIGIEGFTHRLPAGRPIIRSVIIPKVNVSARAVKLVKDVADYSSIGSALLKGVTSGIV